MIKNSQGPKDNYIRNVNITTDIDFISILDESEEPIEVILTGKFKFPIQERECSLSEVIEVEMNIPIHTEIKKLFSSESKLHVITRKNVLDSVKEYLLNIFLDNDSLRQYLSINFLDSHDDKLNIILIAKKPFIGSMPEKDVFDNNLSFTTISVSHPFLSELGLHFDGLEQIEES